MVKTVDRILVPLDGYAGGEHVLDCASAVAQGLGACLSLLHVYWPPNAMVGIVPGASVDEEAAEEASLGEMLLARARDSLHAKGFDRVDTALVRASSPAVAIVDVARVGGCGLVVIGMHGRKRPSVLMGSVAYQVLRTAPCPVLAVHLPHE